MCRPAQLHQKTRQLNIVKNNKFTTSNQVKHTVRQQVYQSLQSRQHFTNENILSVYNKRKVWRKRETACDQNMVEASGCSGTAPALLKR